jgi:hypothetical protein
MNKKVIMFYVRQSERRISFKKKKKDIEIWFGLDLIGGEGVNSAGD